MNMEYEGDFDLDYVDQVDEVILKYLCIIVSVEDMFCSKVMLLSR